MLYILALVHYGLKEMSNNKTWGGSECLLAHILNNNSWVDNLTQKCS